LLGGEELGGRKSRRKGTQGYGSIPNVGGGLKNKKTRLGTREIVKEGREKKYHGGEVVFRNKFLKRKHVWSVSKRPPVGRRPTVAQSSAVLKETKKKKERNWKGRKYERYRQSLRRKGKEKKG